jgi:hypothetical protein
MSIKIKANVFWAQLNEPNEMSGKYQVDLANLSDAAVAELLKLGIKVLNRADDQYERGNYITCKSTYPIKATDNDGLPIPSDTRIGNGSEAIAVVDAFEWTFKGKKGKSPSLSTLVITEIVHYEATDAVPEGSAV